MFFLISIILIFLGLYLIINDLTYFIEFNLINLNSLIIEFTILIDWISIIFIRFVLFISSIVIFYRKYYINGDLNLNRFILLVVIFVISIMILILSPNLISILLGWDGLGLVSYCLVIYYQNVKSYNAGILTILSNRIGDVILLISIAWIINFGRWNFIFYLSIIKLDCNIQLIRILILIAAITKRAQIPFSSWLPAAIAAPTPVSALVHSSTLVTAGIYLLIRFNLVVRFYLNNFILFIGLITIFISGLGANFEFDLKKIIALSTLRQLGLIIRILGLGQYQLAFFHLLIHALFKALLFICAGAFIHNLNNCQDIRFIGSILHFIPLTVAYFNIRNLSLCGIPFFSGFYSKDLVVEFLSFSNFNIFIYLIFYISIGLTVSYRIRLRYYLIIGNFNFYSFNMINENSKILLSRIGIMLFIVIFSGRAFSWVLFSVPYFIILSFFLKILTLFIILIGFLIGLEISKITLSSEIIILKFFKISKFLSLIWNMPYLRTFGVNYLFLSIGGKYYKIIDQGWIENFGSQNIYNTVKLNSKFAQFFLNNNLKIYLLIIISWFLILIIFIFIY